MSDATTRREEVRSTVVEVAARLLHERGPAAVTTRGVAEAAGVQAPTIYRLFGDKDGLLDAVAEHVMLRYASAKAAVADAAAARDVDPVEDLRAGWTSQIDFGLANPAIFRLLSDLDRVRTSPAAASGRQVLESRVARVAAAGALRVSERRAADLLQAAAIGTLHTLLATPPEHRDPGLADAALVSVLDQVLLDVPERADTGALERTTAFRAVAPHLSVLSDAEQRLMTEWLDRIVEALPQDGR